MNINNIYDIAYNSSIPSALSSLFLSVQTKFIEEYYKNNTLIINNYSESSYNNNLSSNISKNLLSILTTAANISNSEVNISTYNSNINNTLSSYEAYYTNITRTDEEIFEIYKYRLIGSVISLFGLSILILLYLILFYKTRCKRAPKEDLYSLSNNQKSNYLIHSNMIEDQHTNSNDLEISNSRKAYVRKNKYKIGIGNDMLFGFAVTQLIYSCSVFVKSSNFNEETPSFSCIAQGFLANFGEISSMAWIGCITHSFMISLNYLNFYEIQRRRIYYVTYSILVAIIFASVPLFTDSYGYAGSWCWLRFETLDNSVIILSIFNLVYFLINFIFQIHCTIVVFKHFNQRYKEIKHDDSKKNEAKLVYQYRILTLLIPIIIIITKGPSCLNRGRQLLMIDTTSIEKIQALTNSIHGFLMSCVYVFYFRQILFECLSCCFCFKKSEKNSCVSNSTNKTLDTKSSEAVHGSLGIAYSQSLNAYEKTNSDDIYKNYRAPNNNSSLRESKIRVSNNSNKTNNTNVNNDHSNGEYRFSEAQISENYNSYFNNDDCRIISKKLILPFEDNHLNENDKTHSTFNILDEDASNIKNDFDKIQETNDSFDNKSIN